MSELTHVRINVPQVVHETIDGEVVIVNFGNGNYYSLVDAGGVVWQSIEGGLGIAGITDELLQRYHADRSVVERGVRDLIAELIMEEIVLPADGDATQSPNPAAAMQPNPPEPQKDFTPPVLQRYTDMEGLLLIDPIHEVDDSGWPNRKPDVTEPA